MTDSIVVTGLGFVCPLGSGAGRVWESWSRQESGIRRLSDGDPRLERGIDPAALPQVGRAAFVRDFDPRAHIRSSHLRRMDWCSRMVVASTAQAVADAGLRLDDDVAQTRTALVVGSCFGNQRETETYMTRVLRKGPAAGQPILFPNLVLNAASGYAAIELSIRGPNLSVSEHEASGEAAVAAALDLLEAGWCDRVVVAGADEFGSVYLHALRERRLLDAESVALKPRPDASRGCIVPGEGAAAMVLERRGDARTRGRRAYATIALARCGAIPAAPHRFAEPAAAAQRMVEMLTAPDVPRRPVSVLLGGANGTHPRAELDRRLLETLAARQATPVGYARLDQLVGDFGARGLLAVALASLAVHHGRTPGTRSTHGDPLERIVVPGSARSGVLVPVAIDMLGSP